MQKIKVGVWDEEMEYVTRLTTFLQKYGKDRWEVSAFTDERAICTYLGKRPLDILIGTDKKRLKQLETQEEVTKLWLSNEENSEITSLGWYTAYRFQSAETIGKYVMEIIRERQCDREKEKKLVAIYSPIGRCGKTTFALDFVKQGEFGKWLYVGMEDYSSFGEEENVRKRQADDFLYYWKEHNEEQVRRYIAAEESVIVSGSSFFDIKGIGTDEVVWLRNIIQFSDYVGAMFDIGSGVLCDFQMFRAFDMLLVPYVEEAHALVKKRNFETLFEYEGMDDYKEKMQFLNMSRKTEWIQVVQRIFGGDEL